MSIRRAVPHALITLVAALALAPASHAALPDPVWLAPQTLGSPGDASSSLGIMGVSGATGGALIAWVVEDPDHGILFQYRTPAGEWGAVQRLGSQSRNITGRAAVARPNGDIVLAWSDHDSDSGDRVRTAILDGDTGVVTTQPPVSTGGGCPNLDADAAGNVYLVYCSDPTFLHTMPAGSNSWGPAEQVSGNNTGESNVHANQNGDVTVYWQTWSPTTIHASTRAAGQDAWSTPETLGSTSDGFSGFRIASNAAGRETAVWFASDGGSYATTYTKTRQPGQTTWGNPESWSGGFTYVPNIAVDASDSTVINFFRNTGAELNVFSTKLGPGASGWSTPEPIIPAGEIGGHLGFAARPDGSLYSLMMHGTDFSSFFIGVRGRAAGADGWAAVENFITDAPSLSDGGTLTSDGLGNLLAVWETADGRPAYAVGDGAGPIVETPVVSATAAVDEPLSFSVTEPTDTWSEVTSTTFDFGDGTTASGTSATHTYAQAGTYTVTVRATDAAGNSTTSASRAIAVEGDDEEPAVEPAPASPVVKPRTLLAPTIEALLSGKRVAVNARLSLKKGASCTGKAVATTRFGTATYRTTLRLKTVGAACRAVGTIKLRKAPSLRTKLRVTVSARAATTRTLTTKRS